MLHGLKLQPSIAGFVNRASKSCFRSGGNVFLTFEVMTQIDCAKLSKIMEC